MDIPCHKTTLHVNHLNLGRIYFSSLEIVLFASFTCVGCFFRSASYTLAMSNPNTPEKIETKNV